MIRELLDGMKSRLRGVGEQSGLPPEGGLPPELKPGDAAFADITAGIEDRQAPEQDFTALLGGQDTSELEEKVKGLEDRSNKLESQINETLNIAKSNSERLDSIDTNMKKFLSLYELVTNQINPFVDKQQPFKQQKQMLALDGTAVPEEEDDTLVMPSAEELEAQPEEEILLDSGLSEPDPEPEIELPDEPAPAPEPVIAPAPQPVKRKPAPAPKGLEDEQLMFMQSVQDGNASFVLEWITSLVSEDGTVERNSRLLKYLVDLGWITPKAYEALQHHLKMLAQSGRITQGQEARIPIAVGVPQQAPPRIPVMPPMMGAGRPPLDNVDSLMPVLEWVKYLVDKVGHSEATEILKYLVQLEWITPEAHEALLKYIETTVPGMEGLTRRMKAVKPQAIQIPVGSAATAIPTPTEFIESEFSPQVPIKPPQPQQVQQPPPQQPQQVQQPPPQQPQVPQVQQPPP